MADLNVYPVSVQYLGETWQIINGRGQVDVISGGPGGGGTQYQEGDVVSPITGTAVLWEDAGDTLRVPSAVNPLPVNIVAGSSSGVQYTEGNTDSSITGTAVMWEDAGDTLRPVSAALPLPVNTELPTAAALGDTDANPTTPQVGSCLQGWNGASWYRAGGSAANGLEVDIRRIAAGTTNIGDVDIASLPNEGQQTMANSISVAISSDQSAIPVSGTVSVTEPVSVDDNGGSLTVDGTVAVSSIAAGTNNIGDVDIASLPNEGQQTMANSISVAIASDQTNVPVSQATASNLNAQVVGSIAHDTADSGNPVKMGLKAISYGAAPSAVTANDRTDWYGSRHGVPWVLGGHPNIITREITILDSDGAQTNASLLGTIASGTAVVITMIDVMASGANTVDVKVRIGFGTASVPAASVTGVNGVVLSHSKIKAGSGVVKGTGAGIVAQGASDEELRITCDDPAGGAITVTVTYHTIEI